VSGVKETRRLGAHAGPVLLTFVPLVGLAAAQGGYFPTAWGWASVPLLWAVAIAMIVRTRAGLGRADAVFLAALVAFTGWVALSAAWSAAPAASVLETERGLVYVGATAALLLVARARSSRYVLGAVLAAVTVIAAFSLATRVLPDRVGVYDGSGIYRLAQPIGYWNGLGLFVAVGSLLALGFTARARTVAARSAAAAVLVLLLPTLYFTFSRGAWIALGVGLVAAVAVDPRRLQLVAALLVVAPLPALAVLLSSHEKGLTRGGSSLAAAAHDGHRLAVLVLLLAAGNAAIGALFALVARSIHVGKKGERTFALAIAVLVTVALGSALVDYGGPVHVAKRAYSSFTAPLPPARSDLNGRLLSFSGNGRSQLWGLAWDDAQHHRILGAGAGTYERYFLAHEPRDVSRVRDAHSLYVETLAEVGPVGLSLLVVLLATPLAALARARRHPVIPAAAGAYVAYLVHAGVDWDWELPAVTLAGLFCGVAILLAARSSGRRTTLAPWLRWAIAGCAVALAAFGTVGLVGNAALSRSVTEREHGNAAAAATAARRARFLMPWSPTPWDMLGRAQLAGRLPLAARASFEKAISIDRGDWQLWFDLSRVTNGAARAHALAQVALLYPQSQVVSTAARRP
jgi:hypothetical protein